MILPAWAKAPPYAAIIYALNVAIFAVNLALIGSNSLEFIKTIGAVPPPIATILVGVAGFATVAWQAKIGFANLVKAQEHSAKIESDGRREQAAIQRDQVEQDHAYNQRTLAASLHGELIALLSRVHGSRGLMFTQWKIFEAAAQDHNLRDLPSILTPPTYSVPVFESCIPKLGLLGPSIAGDVVEVFSRAAITPTGEPAKLKPDILAKLYKVIYDSHLNWSDEIVRVASRLASLQSAGMVDPGTLHEMRQAKEADKRTA